MESRPTEFSSALLGRIRAAVGIGDVITTLSSNQPNRIVAVVPSGVLVETDRSVKRGSGPQLVPAWMIQRAWDHLTCNGTLTNRQLLDDLNVKRSSFVCALLARFPGVEVVTDRPITLRLAR